MLSRRGAVAAAERKAHGRDVTMQGPYPFQYGMLMGLSTGAVRLVVSALDEQPRLLRLQRYLRSKKVRCAAAAWCERVRAMRRAHARSRAARGGEKARHTTDAQGVARHATDAQGVARQTTDAQGVARHTTPRVCWRLPCRHRRRDDD